MQRGNDGELGGLVMKRYFLNYCNHQQPVEIDMTLVEIDWTAANQ
jgi:hypothetical protein